MLTKGSKFFLIATLILAVAFTFSSCDMGNGVDSGLDIEFDETYNGMNDYFVFDYPGEWYIVSEHISADEEYILVSVASDPDTMDELDMEANHYLSVTYYIDYDWAFREDEEEFYYEIENMIQEMEKDEGVEILIEKKIDFKDRPAFELKVEAEHPDPEISKELIQHGIVVFENSHHQPFYYRAKADEYSENIASTFFDSFEFMTD